MAKKNDKNNDILISIIVPVYNTSKYLVKCLDSIYAAIDNDCEVIIVNDGSTDDSEKIIKDYISNLKNEEIYLGKDIRAFTNKLFNNQLSSCYYDLFKEMQKGFNCIEVDNDDEKVLAINLAKFLCIYPYVKITVKK